MFKLSKESKLTFLFLLIIPFAWIGVNHFGFIENWKTKSLDLRLSSTLPGARGEILHNKNADEMVMVEGNKSIPKIPKIVYVNFDAATLAMDDVGERPWDRAFFRDMSMALMKKGKARVLTFDFGFTPKSVSKMVPKENSFRSDSAMGELVKSYPSQIVLGCLYSGVQTPFVKAIDSSAFPPLFADGYLSASSELSGNYNYPESPTYPLQNFLDGKYIGRTGSFTVPPFRAVDNVPRWVPLWFPAGGKAHAYNVLGGKQSKLPFEIKNENMEELLETKKTLDSIINEKKELLSELTTFEQSITESMSEKETALKDYQSISKQFSVFNALEKTIKNFKLTLKANASLEGIIQPQLDARVEERSQILYQLSSVDTGGDLDSVEDCLSQIKELNSTIVNLQVALDENPAIAGIIEPQLLTKQKEIIKLESKINKMREFSLSPQEEEELLEKVSNEVAQRKKVIDQITIRLASSAQKINALKEKLSKIEVSEELNNARIEQLEGRAETTLIETNNTLRLVYKGVEGQNDLGKLVDSEPNEMPLNRDRDIYTLGVESLLAYYGLDEGNVVIAEDKSLFSIIDNSGKPLVEAPLTENQFLEVNWFSGWSPPSPEKKMMMDAKRAYGDKDIVTYKSLIPSILKKVLMRVENFSVPTNASDYPDAMNKLGVGKDEVEVARKLLTTDTPVEELPSFDDFIKTIDGIAYYFIPPTLESKYNPMCGMKDVLQNSRFEEEVLAQITLIEEKIKSLGSEGILGKIELALEQDPDNEKLLSQKGQVENALLINNQNLIAQKEELKRINDFFSKFENAIVLIGPEEKTFQDLAPTPFDKAAAPKVGVHGNLIKTLTSGFYIKRLGIEVDHAATLAVGLIMALLAVYQGNRSSWVQAGGIILLLGYVFFGFVTFSNTHVVWPITAPACAGISTSFIGLAVMVVIEQKAKGRLKGMFGSYVSSELVDQMVESGEEPSLGGQETAITAFFSDVQAFSSFSELLSPTGLVDLMNEYLTAMTNILQEERGTLDKYIGDAIVAMYGAPIPMDDHAYQSVRTAILMQQEQIKLREKWSHEEEKWGECYGLVSKMQTRIGCNTGTATVGNMGALDRFNYTMMGDMVNLAARCESGAKAYGAYIMITEETMLASKKTRDDIAFRYLDRIVVKGRKQPVAMYEPTGFMRELNQETQDCLDCFKQGIDKYLKQDWNGALDLFEKSKNLEPNRPGVTPGVVDNPSMILIDRCKVMKDNPPGDDWDGVFVMTSK